MLPPRATNWRICLARGIGNRHGIRQNQQLERFKRFRIEQLLVHHFKRNTSFYERLINAQLAGLGFSVADRRGPFAP